MSKTPPSRLAVPTPGADETIDSARHFSAAANRIAALIDSQKSLLIHASHELRSPLTRIRMAVELAWQSDTGGQRARTEILHNLNELDRIIEKILLASRVEIKSSLYDAEPVDLIGLLNEACVHPSITLSIAPGVTANPSDFVVRGSPLLLRQAVCNLLENAAQHGKHADGTSQTSVLLEYENTAPPAVLVHVDDCGPGIPADQREHIFEPFYVIPSTPTRGFGLGLALVRIIAQRHGGSVTCSGREGGGMRFTLRLPSQEVAPQAQLT